MKKILAILLSFCMLLPLLGCGGTPESPTGPAMLIPEASSEPDAVSVPEDSAAPGTDPAAYQLPMAAVSLPNTQEVTKAEDGTTVFEYSYPNISLIVQDPEVADQVIVDFLNRIDATVSPAQEIRSQAQGDYSGQNGWYPYSFSVTYSPTRIDQGVLSLFGKQSSYSGGMHPNYACVSATYDLVTGKSLYLSDILAEDGSAAALCQHVVDALASQAEEKYLYDDYANTVEARLSMDPEADEDWYFSQTGLCFYFSPYDIAPYASGVIVAEVPYERLTGILDDAYFPAEQDGAAGTVEARLFADADLEQFNQFAELILEEDGEAFLLYTGGMVYDLQITQGNWTTDGTAFIPSAVVFAASSLTPGDAVMVQASLPDTASQLCLTYRSGEETVTAYITQSGNDGSIVLSENE